MLLTSLLFGLSDAHACSCLWKLDVFPSDGAIDVPLDVTPVVSPTWGSVSPVLRDLVSGEVVPTSIARTVQGDGELARLVPDVPLLPDHAYAVEDPQGTTTFTTGTTSDDTAPARPDLIAIGGGYHPNEGSPCGESVFLQPEVRETSDDPDVVYEFEVSRAGSSEPPVSFVAITLAEAYLGHGPCGGTVHGLAEGDEVEVRVRAIDLSGNQGPWSDARSHTLLRIPWEGSESPGEEATGCRTVAPAGGLFGWVGLLLALRRRHTRGR
jgi:hypothetical protein